MFSHPEYTNVPLSTKLAIALVGPAMVIVTTLSWDKTQARTNQNCSQETRYCVLVTDKSDKITFQIQNNADYNQTVTLKIENLKNLISDRPLPVTWDVPPLTKGETLTLFLNNQNEPYNYKYQTYYHRGKMNASYDGQLYRFPFTSSSGYRLIQGHFGTFSHNNAWNYYALDFDMPEGTPVHAAREGKVLNAVSHNTENGLSEEFYDKSNHILIEHSDGTIAEYHHLRTNGTLVKEGQYVQQGDVIGYSGNTGYSDGPHLHFNVYTIDNSGNKKSLKVGFMSQTGRTIHTLSPQQYYK